MKERICVIGAGAWGTALADLLAKKGHPVSLWVYEKDLADEITGEHENRLYLPGVPLSPRIRASSSPEEVCRGCGVFVIVVPSHFLRGVAGLFREFLPSDALVMGASKGIENRTLMTPSQILPEVFTGLPAESFAYLSGPSFAVEVARELPTAVAVASRDRGTARRVQALFTTPFFRVYTTPDVMGVELGGSLKNVLAIAVGICDGLGFGNNARAALITRGLTEMSRLGAAMGASPMTFMGLAGLGDLVLTCTGDLSRNRTVGLALGRGDSLEAILSHTRTVAEGVKTTRAVYGLSQRHGVEMPITHQVYRVLYEEADPKEAVRELMGRDPREEAEETAGAPRVEWES